MHMTYDGEADAAYITLAEESAPSESAQQVAFIDTPNGQTQLILDVDSEGYLIGIEILAASAGLRGDVLDKAQRL
ncbi:hypothetical protein CPHO_09930 [Corynebacterium phocae]|uniref:DUF2283 domain-containing protein n=1 Tax=Corynebacterium phocae TaxID=161895 RepID=A0A1L7D4T0_9CORY|nr:DUF2283 domain-containing protein [Corynebacterium phocae]APT93154.1 hypothetical protein CPHO_09930 [Corynebacterium phocae]KAA8722233.1 DUF2283 domain-containing protein [Corynebacterium phocae]